MEEGDGKKETFLCDLNFDKIDVNSLRNNHTWQIIVKWKSLI